MHGLSVLNRIDCNVVCFSLFLLALSSEFSSFGLWLCFMDTGVLKSWVVVLFVGAIATTASLAN